MKGISNAAFIATAQTVAPGYKKQQHSMASHPETYGVVLAPQISALFAPKRARRKRAVSFTCRLDEWLSAEFNSARFVNGQTITDALESAVMLYIDKTKETRNGNL